MRLIRRLLFSIALLFVGLAQPPLPAPTVVHAATYGPGVTVQVKVDIAARTSEGIFRDSLYLTQAEFDALTDRQLNDLKTARINAWVAAVQAARNNPPPKPTRAELQARLAALQAEEADVQAQIDVTPSAPAVPSR